jgi:hypothetical protein
MTTDNGRTDEDGDHDVARLFRPARPVLSDRLAAAGVETQRALALLLAERAERLITSQRGQQALMAIRTGRYGDIALQRALQDDADTANLRSQQADERGDKVTGEREFAAARAAAVLAFALDADAEEASQGTAYESWSLGDRAEVEEIITRMLA